MREAREGEGRQESYTVRGSEQKRKGIGTSRYLCNSPPTPRRASRPMWCFAIALWEITPPDVNTGIGNQAIMMFKGDGNNDVQR